MRTLAIGDIHGCSRALDVLLRAVLLQPEDRLVTLGDYVDRGPDSFGVLERLLALHATGQLIALRGNHEQLLLDAREHSAEEARLWLECGGKATLHSYGIEMPTAADLKAIPQRHWNFLANDCRDWYEIDTHFFVHGDVAAELPLHEQPPYILYWEKLYQAEPHVSGKIMVCGHTRQHSGLPRNLGYAVCIDTGAYGPNGWLTCLDVHTGQLWQANQRGHFRDGYLDEPEAFDDVLWEDD